MAVVAAAVPGQIAVAMVAATSAPQKPAPMSAPLLVATAVAATTMARVALTHVVVVRLHRHLVVPAGGDVATQDQSVRPLCCRPGL